MASPRPGLGALGRSLALLAALALVAALAGCGSSSKSGTAGSTTATSAAKPADFQAAGTLEPVQQAPPLQLHNYLGQPVNIDSYRGKAVLITFVYTHCPDVCPLIVSNLRVAQKLLGPEASKAQIIAVSVDPKGDTPKTVAKFLASHEMTGKMQYLIGNTKELATAWKAWGVGAGTGRGQPRPDRALGARLRDHRLRQAADDLLGQLQAGGDRPRRPAPGRRSRGRDEPGAATGADGRGRLRGDRGAGPVRTEIEQQLQAGTDGPRRCRANVSRGRP